MSAPDSVAERVEAERAEFAAGWDAALAAHPPCEHTHPAVIASVASLFPGWDGADAALARSITRFRTWHAATRSELLKEAA